MDAIKGFSLEEEVRCDHLVTADVKKLWAKQMELALQLEAICKKHHIKYFALGGTLLGAVRHKGYIPWDDDMDFGMLKEDYDRFCQVAAQELEEPFVFRNNVSFSRLRNNQTTAATQRELSLAVPPYDFGIFIDIFPLFSVPDSVLKQKLHRLPLRFLRAVRYGRRIEKFEKHEKGGGLKTMTNPKVLSYKLWSVFHKDDSLTERYMKACGAFEKSQHAAYVGLTSFSLYDPRTTWKKESFEGDPIIMEFENMTVPAPRGYDDILRTQYGDYMVFVKGAAMHETMIIDTERPCSYYIEKIAGRNK
ncbi:MAG: LicD family protein [Lachnospiraceae bacterium]|nr:LicD family protein [Lachnospiraceae bacterium]